MITMLLQCCPDSAAIMKCVYEYEAATNDKDVQIFQEICGAIVLVAVIVVGGFLLLKLFDHIANGIHGLYKRKWEEEDREQKQKADLKDKLLDFLEKNTSKEEYNEEAGKVIKSIKDFDSTESQYYIDVLKNLINNNPIPNYSSHENKEQKNTVATI